MSTYTSSYQKPDETVPFATPDESAVVQEQSQERRLGLSKALAILVTAFGFVALVSHYHDYGSSSSNAQQLTVDLLGTSKVTPCTFNECAKANCDHDLAPYTCLIHNGGPHGGCSAYPWTAGSCTTQCDLSGCDDLEVPDSVADCSADCPLKWCENSGRLCGSDVSYQCMVGSSAFGCSSDPYQWTFKVSNAACSSCCDVTSC